jgi:hypothetical protein
MDGNGGTMRERNFFKEKLNLKKDLLHGKVENQNQFEGFEFFNFLILFFFGVLFVGVMLLSIPRQMISLLDDP